MQRSSQTLSLRYQRLKSRRPEEREMKNIVVGIRMDESGKEILKWVLDNVTEAGDCVVVVHVCLSSRRAVKIKESLDHYLEAYRAMSATKKVELKANVLKGSSVQRVLVKEAKSFNSMAVVVGIKKHTSLSDRAFIAKGCAKQLPPETRVIAIHRGTIVFRRPHHLQLPQAHGMDLKPSWKLSDKENRLEPDKSSVKEEILNKGKERKRLLGLSASMSSVEALEQKPGWPLLRRSASDIAPQTHHRRRESVVQWVMSLPERFPQERNSTSQLKDILKNSNQWFSYSVLKSATSDFSPENLIGKGGCNRVYKGILEDGKQVAVKILKPSSMEALTDFVHEISIISSLNHQHISPLLGVCVQDNDLISLYDYSSNGSLEETLCGHPKGKHVLSWKERFNIATRIAEALDYLHNRCSKPVIHRDVKSSNILLFDGFEPQLSDFGLAMWGPTSSSKYIIRGDVVGTFGYLAPEYFMYGKVSDKVDVYAFGVVLLELISGRTPILSQTARGQDLSLVMWAKPMIDRGDSKGLLDPNLSERFEESQFQRMVMAATLCLTRSATLRPNITEILKLLRGENDMEKWVVKKMQLEEEEEEEDREACFDDEVYPNSSPELHLTLAMLDVEKDSVSFSSFDHTADTPSSSSSC